MTQWTKYVLLVEDDRDDLELALGAFAQMAFPPRVEVARDGVAALDYLLDPGRELPALVLLDLKLPRLSGLQVLRRLRDESRTRTLPVVMLTSSDEHTDLRAAYLLGVNSFVRKPVDYQRFLAAMEALHSYWLELNEPPPSKEGSE